MFGEPVGPILFTSSSLSGYLITTTNNTVGVIMTPQTRIVHIHLISGATPSVIIVRNGQGGSILINEKGKSNKGVDFDFGMWGVVFPLGAYITYDGNQLQGVITVRGEDNYVLASITGTSGGILDDSGNQILDDSGNVILDDSGN